MARSTRPDDAGQRYVPTEDAELAGHGASAPPAERTAAERLRDSRSRRFAEIESAIIAEERALRRLVWEIPKYDVRVRLLAAQRIAHRKEHLAESARLAEARRSAIDARSDATLPGA